MDTSSEIAPVAELAASQRSLRDTLALDLERLESAAHPEYAAQLLDRIETEKRELERGADELRTRLARLSGDGLARVMTRLS